MFRFACFAGLILSPLLLGQAAQDGFGKPVNGLAVKAEWVDPKAADAATIRVTLKNMSDKPITICDYVGDQPLKVEWIGPDGNKIRSDHYGWLRAADIAAISERNFPTLPAGGTIGVGPRGNGSDVILRDLKPGKHRITISYVNRADGAQFGLKGVWTGTVNANEVAVVAK